MLLTLPEAQWAQGLHDCSLVMLYAWTKTVVLWSKASAHMVVQLVMASSQREFCTTPAVCGSTSVRATRTAGAARLLLAVAPERSCLQPDRAGRPAVMRPSLSPGAVPV